MKEWMPKNNIIKFFTIATALIFIMYITGIFVVFAGIQKVRNFYNSIESESTKENKILAIKSAIEENKEDIEKIRNFFIQKGDEVKFIEQIEKTAKGLGVRFEIDSIEVKSPEEGSLKENVEIRADVLGNWNNIFRFLDKLNKMPFGVTLQNFELMASRGEWSGKLDLIVFREK